MSRCTSRTPPPAGCRSYVARLGATALFGFALLAATPGAAQSIQPPEIVSRDYGTNAHLRFASETGIVYRVIVRTNLAAGAWTAIRAGVTEATETDVDLASCPESAYYRIMASTYCPIPYDYYTWHRALSNPDYAHRVRGYIIYYPSSIEVAIELMDLKTGQWKPVLKSATGPAAAYSKYLRDVSPDNQVIVHGHDNSKLHPEVEYYLHIRQVANPSQKVVVTIPEPLETLRFNEDLTITVNGQFTYTRDGQAVF